MVEKTANYDDTWKDAITNYLADFLAFFYPEVYQVINWEKTPISLDKELEQITAASQTIKRSADKLFKVWLKDDQEVWILIHVEVQSQYDSEFTQRMFIYNYRAFDLYHKPVISLAILGDESKRWRPNSYQYGFGDSQVRLTFSIVKLLDYEWEELQQSENLFAIIVMAHLKTKVTTSNLTEREQWKWNLARLMYQKGYNRKQIADLYKVIDLMMTLPDPLQLSFEEKLTQYQEELKMPLLTNIEQRALEKVLNKVLNKDLNKDLNKVSNKVLNKELNHSSKASYLALQNRFGELPNSLIQAINQIEDISLLDQLFVPSLTVNSLEEFEQLINRNLGATGVCLWLSRRQTSKTPD
jgi:hypothetical protein